MNCGKGRETMKTTIAVSGEHLKQLEFIAHHYKTTPADWLGASILSLISRTNANIIKDTEADYLTRKINEKDFRTVLGHAPSRHLARKRKIYSCCAKKYLMEALKEVKKNQIFVEH